MDARTWLITRQFVERTVTLWDEDEPSVAFAALTGVYWLDSCEEPALGTAIPSLLSAKASRPQT